MPIEDRFWEEDMCWGLILLGSHLRHSSRDLNLSFALTFGNGGGSGDIFQASGPMVVVCCGHFLQQTIQGRHFSPPWRHIRQRA